MSTYFENVHTIFKRTPQFPALCQNTYQNTSSLAALQKRSVLPRQVAAFGLGEDVQEEDGEVSVEDLGADGRDRCLASPSLILSSVCRRAAHRSIGQTLQGSFSAVSKPNVESKYAFQSSRRDLHNALLCTALQSHFL